METAALVDAAAKIRNQLLEGVALKALCGYLGDIAVSVQNHLHAVGGVLLDFAGEAAGEGIRLLGGDSAQMELLLVIDKVPGGLLVVLHMNTFFQKNHVIQRLQFRWLVYVYCI